MRISMRAAIVGFAFLPRLAFGDVLVVAITGAPHSSIQSAVDAAAEGDTILIRPGFFAGFDVRSKSLSVVADVEGAVTLTSGTWITYLAAGQRVSLAGMRYPSGGLICFESSGSIRLEGMVAQPVLWPGTPAHGLRVQDCADVAVLRCSLSGSPSGMFPASPGIGLRVIDSTIAVYDSSVTGGKGQDGAFNSTPGLSGASGASVSGSSTFFASATTFQGGEGGAGMNGICTPYTIGGSMGASGGTGLTVHDGSQAYLLDSKLTGGPGGRGGPGGSPCGTPPGPQGPAGPAVTGTVRTFPGRSAVLRCATNLRESNALSLTLEGDPGDLVYARLSATPQWALTLPLSGVQLVGSRSRTVFLGAIPATGSLSTSTFFGPLAPGVESQTVYLQTLMLGAAGSVRCGSGAVVVVLDAAF